MAGEGLLGIGGGVLDGVAGVERGGALVEGCVAVPVVGAALSGDDDGAGGGAAGVGVLLAGADGELLDGVGGEVLEEASDVVVGVVAAVDGELVVEAGAAASGDGGNARLGGVGGLDGLGARGEVGDVGEAARGEREGLEVFGGDDALMDAAGEVDGLGGDGGAVRGDGDGLLDLRGLQGDGEVADGADGDGDVGGGGAEAVVLDADVPEAGREVVEAELAVGVGEDASGLRGAGAFDEDGGVADAGARGVLDDAAQGSAGVLRK